MPSLIWRCTVLDVISNGLRYKGKQITAGKKIKNVPRELAERWIEMKLARNKTKDGFEKATKPAEETSVKVDKTEGKKDDDVDLSLKGLTKKPGGWYGFPDGSTAHGKKKAEEKLAKWNVG